MDLNKLFINILNKLKFIYNCVVCGLLYINGLNVKCLSMFG